MDGRQLCLYMYVYFIALKINVQISQPYQCASCKFLFFLKYFECITIYLGFDLLLQVKINKYDLRSVQ